MKLVVGLGNPGARYAGTRHNAGFRVLARLAERHRIALDAERFGGAFGQGAIGQHTVALLAPQGFMNRSGESVAAALRGLAITDPRRDLLVVYDEVDLPFGRLRLRPGGGAGGHRGLVDVLARCEREDLPRLRVGVGRPEGAIPTDRWVLAPFAPDEEQALPALLDRAADAAECFLAAGIEAAMNRFNAEPGDRGGEAPGLGTVPGPTGETMSHVPHGGRPPRRPQLADRLVRPFQRFLELEVSSALLLVAMTVLALAWANSPFAESYFDLWHTYAGVQIGEFFQLKMSLGHWVNDALMAIFFFLVGMEIKRELVEGELSTRARAMLPVMGALGGMVVPAGIYAAIHWGEPTIRGWGIPMATDIAFAVAALSLLGKRVPSSLRIFLLALAIADDIGAVAVIAIFYTAELNLDALAYSGAGMVLIIVLQRIGVRSFLVYGIVGVWVWLEMHHSGVHATIAGVALGFLTPTEVPADDKETLVERGFHAIERLREVVLRHNPEQQEIEDHGGHERHHLVMELREVGREVLSPLDYVARALEAWVAFVIMPIFALANAGVAINASTLADPTSQQVGVAVALGLLVGKPIGIALFSFVAVRSGIAVLPRGVNWAAVTATGLLAGIGFTVALFVTSLAFVDANATDGAKIGILAGSLAATLLGLGVLVRALPKSGDAPAQA